MRVVFDTNVFVSALTLAGGRGDQALARIIDGLDTLFISKPIVDELLGVLARKFARDREQLARTAVFLSNLAEVVAPNSRLKILADAPDNRILECALAGNAELIVTGHRAMLALAEYEHVRIVTLSEYFS